MDRQAFTVALSPTDLRRNPPPAIPGVPWAADLHRDLRAALVAVAGAR